MPTGSIYANRNYMLLFVGQMLSSIGSSVYSFALLWDMKLLTGNPLFMSLVAVGWALPAVLIGPFAGVLVDRMRKRLAMLFSDTARLILTAMVTALAWVHALTPWEILAFVTVSSVAATLFNPAAASLTPLMVREEQLSGANGLEQGAGTLAQILGPALSAVLIAIGGVGLAFAANAVSYVISVGTLWFVRSAEPAKENRPFTVHHLLTELGEGWSALTGIRLLMVLMPAALILNFVFAPIDVYIIQFVTVVLHRAQVAVGAWNSVFAAGLLVGAVLAGPLGARVRPGLMMGYGLLLSFVALLVMALVPAFVVDVVLAAFAGVGLSLANVTIFTMVQRTVARDVMGRVFALIGTVFGAATPIGLVVGGALAKFAPIDPLFATMASIGIALAIIILAIPFVRSVPVFGQEPPGASEAATETALALEGDA